MGARRGKGGQTRQRTPQGSAPVQGKRQGQPSQTARKPTLVAPSTAPSTSISTSSTQRQAAPANGANGSNGSNGSNSARQNATGGDALKPAPSTLAPTTIRVANTGADSSSSRVATLEPATAGATVADQAAVTASPITLAAPPSATIKTAPARRIPRARATAPEADPVDPDADAGRIERTPLTPARFAEHDADVTAGILAATRRDLISDTLRGGWSRVRHLSYETWAWIGVLGLAIFLRFWNLGAKPLHHDESMHAFYSLMFARDPSSYLYDPLLHGPFQFHAEGIMFAIILGLQAIFHVSGPGNNPWINDATARIVPALFGVGIVALPLGLRREIGRIGALVAAFLLAVSPSFVYFSRFLREDIYFNFFMFAMVVCAVRFAHRRSILWLALTMLATVLAYATFEGIYLTFAIFGAFLAALVAWEIAWSVAKRLPATLTERERLFFSRAGLLALLAALGAVCAWIGLHIIDNLNVYVLANQSKADIQVAQLEANTVVILLYVSIGVA
ncbi:MAG: flippase activity-associated protein Agl23, partial [Ktedonobacterales bacterium]